MIGIRQVLLFAFAFCVALGTAYCTGYDHAKRDFKAELTAQNAKALELENERKAEALSKLDKAISERDRARSLADSLYRDNDQLAERLRIAERSSKASSSGKSAPGSNYGQNSGCRRYLAEAVEIAGECERLARQLNADRIAVKNLQ